MASGALPGDLRQASVFSLPEAVTTTIPASTMLSSALLRAEEKPPPSDMEATAGLIAFLPTQSIELVIPNVVPDPESLRTFTACRVTPLATPNCFPPTVPAQCVPWPCLSKAHPTSPLHSLTVKPSHAVSSVGMARSSKSWCVVRMPVSKMYACTPLPPSAAPKSLLGRLSTSRPRTRRSPQGTSLVFWEAGISGVAWNSMLGSTGLTPSTCDKKAANSSSVARKSRKGTPSEWPCCMH